MNLTTSINLAAHPSDFLGLPLVEIPAGVFLMGSPEEEKDSFDDERPQHLVKLESFFMSQMPITQAQWRAVAQWKPRKGERWGRELEQNPSRFQQPGDARPFQGETSTDDRPVEQVSWEEAMEFCSRLSQRTGRTFTLPSEAQWEYACRAGTTTPFAFGETLTPDLANYDGNYTYGTGPKGAYREQTTPVGMFPANDWGLQDMHGTVREWCLDHWHFNYEGAPEDGSAWLTEEGETGCCAAAPGTTIPGSAARPAAASSCPALPATRSGFVWCVFPFSFSMTESSSTSYGLFSEQAANEFGSSIFLTPDGKEVEVTFVYTTDGFSADYGFADKVFVGQVTEFLRKGRIPTHNY